MQFSLDNAIAPIFVLIWSTGFVITRLAMLLYIEPATFLFWRFAGVLAAMAALSLAWKSTWTQLVANQAHCDCRHFASVWVFVRCLVRHQLGNDCRFGGHHCRLTAYCYSMVCSLDLRKSNAAPVGWFRI